MSELITSVPDIILAGRLRKEYLLPVDSQPYLGNVGGNLAYAAAAALMWNAKPGMVARINRDFPESYLEDFELAGADVSGIRPSSEPIDDRFFAAYDRELKPHFENPISWFAERQLPFPQELLSYTPSIPIYCSKTDYRPDSLRITDLSPLYLEASAAHISPIDFVSHKILPSLFKAGMALTLTMRACNCYMDPIFWEEIRSLISDVTAFMMTDSQALKLFQGRSVDLWEIARILADYGPEYIIINTKDGSVKIWSRLNRQRWIIPAYSTKISDPTGMYDAFDAGFLASYRKNYDVIDAALHGMVSASFCVEGSGPLFLLDCLPGLTEARLGVLGQSVMEG